MSKSGLLLGSRRMEITTSLAELPAIHPNLVWPHLIVACASVLDLSASEPSRTLEVALEGIASFDDETLTLRIQPAGIDADELLRLSRTFDASRRIEMAAIVVAALILFHVAHLEIRDIAVRGSRADYLVGEQGYLLEIGGRSRRQDLAAAWREKWRGLLEREVGGFFLSLTEFESPAGRFAFQSGDHA